MRQFQPCAARSRHSPYSLAQPTSKHVRCAQPHTHPPTHPPTPRSGLRVLHVACQIEGIRVVTYALRLMLPALTNVLWVGLLFYYIFAVSKRVVVGGGGAAAAVAGCGLPACGGPTLPPALPDQCHYPLM